MVEIDHLRILFECLEENKPIPEYIRYDLTRIKDYVLNYQPDRDLEERIQELDDEVCDLEFEIGELEADKDELRQQIEELGAKPVL